MSYTIASTGHEETDRRLENVVNRIQRHCRIGKVARKPAPIVPAISELLGGLRVKQPYPPLMNFPRSPEYMPQCGCKVGTACGNVACPHRLVATC